MATAIKVYTIIGFCLPYFLHQLSEGSTTELLTPGGYGCPTGWIDGEGACYRRFSETPLGWTDAVRSHKHLSSCVW